LRALDADLGGSLLLRRGNPVDVVPAVAAGVDADEVHAAFDFGPYGSHRDRAVDVALSIQRRQLVQLGSPYAVAPGRVTKQDGSAYQVFTPFHRAWLEHGWRSPVPRTATAFGRPLASEPLPDLSAAGRAGEAAALQRWHEYLDGPTRVLYPDLRDRPDLDATSHLSVALKFGELHPRTVLDSLGPTRSDEALRRQLAWREFYADVLHHRPDSARGYYRTELAGQEYDDANTSARLVAWQTGRTGYPFVDAGMRQLLAQGWMHNRLRMVVASFLVKDLHLEWNVGARWFMQQLVDADLASNSHGWQWVAGTGTDAAPYHRIFNPVTQGRRFDPDGGFVRRYVPELRHLTGAAVHEPWASPDGLAHGYPERIVDHDTERKDALRRYAEVRNQG